MDNWSRPFFRSMLSESDGNVSSARFCIVLVVVAVVLFGGSQIPKLAHSLGSAQKEFKKGLKDGAGDPVITALVLHDRKLPDLGAVGGYVTLVCGSLYAINRGASILEHKQTSTQGGS